MAFMALFGWIFIPIIILFLIRSAFVTAVNWAVAHAFLINIAVVVVVAVNLLILAVLLRVRGKWKREGRRGRWILTLAAVWEILVVLFWGGYLAVQPLQYIPEGFGEILTIENTCFDEWEITGCQGALPGYTCTQETLEQYLGTRIQYREDGFTSGGQSYALDGNTPYEETVVWREYSVVIPKSMLRVSFEELDISRRNLRRGVVNFKEAPGDYPVGWLFYVLDRDTLMVYDDCFFFRAERVD